MLEATATPPVPTITRFAALQSLLRTAERAWMVIFLSVTSGAYFSLIHRTMDAESDDLEVSPLVHLVLLPLYAIMGCVIVTHPRGFARVARRGWPALVLVGLACFSTLWSVEPDLTLRRGISLLAPTALGLVIALRFTSRELLRLLALALGIAAVLSVVVALLLPTQGIMINYDAWRGVYQTKNAFGRAMALEVAVLVLVALDGKRYRTLAWLGATGALGLVLLSKSVGSLVAAIAVLTLIPLFQSLRLRFTTTVAVCTISFLLGAILFTVIVANAEPVFALLGRDPTLTGRTAIWAAALGSIAERPWLGYGHNAFWQGWVGPSMSVLSAVGWGVPNSHNGLVDLWLELGLVGVLTFLLGLGVAARAAVVSARRTGTGAGLWPLVFLSFLVLINVSMSTILAAHSLYWILYVAILSSDLLTKQGERQSMAAASELSSSRFRGDPRLSGTPAGGRVSPGVRRFFGRVRHVVEKPSSR